MSDTGSQSDTVNGSAGGNKIRVAQYVRMSTEHQKYSTDNQSLAIRKYADANNMEIVEYYSDSGKSGLNIDGRSGLKQLIMDVDLGEVNFTAVLVFDISRWGRFQDADESAYYEYICKRSGIAVHYCAEQFENDGSPVSTIVKGVKRAMAGEYSRELSAKVFAGQCRLIEKGFRQGGAAGYGLRRMLIGDDGERKGILKPGQHKSLQTDRVILVPGPDDEVRVVNQMYQRFVERGMHEREIADELNHQGYTTDFGRPWTRGTVRQILTNEKYIGHNVFNRTSFKLKKRHKINDPDEWVRADNAFKAIVPLEMFHMARGIIRERSRKLSNDEMLGALERLYKKYGFLSGLIIDESETAPSSCAYSHRFGSLLRAYSLVGFTPDRDYSYLEINRRLREFHPTVIAKVIEEITQLGAACDHDPSTQLLKISEEFTLSIAIARHSLTPAGSSRWKVRFDSGLRPDVTVAVRMDKENTAALDYYILPMIDFRRSSISLAERNRLAFEVYRFPDLTRLFDMARRQNIGAAA